MGLIISKCAEDPTVCNCTADKIECAGKDIYSVFADSDSVVKVRCVNKVYQQPETIEVCGIRTTFNGPPCESGTSARVENFCMDGRCQSSNICGTNSKCESSASVICAARDPNIKYGPAGAIEAGQKLDYRVEFENEGDELIDCDDPDCSGQACVAVCDDGIDNDGDGFVDCADTDCDCSTPTPTPTVEGLYCSADPCGRQMAGDKPPRYDINRSS